MAFYMHALLVIRLVGVMEEMFELELVMITSGENLHVQLYSCQSLLVHAAHLTVITKYCGGVPR